MLPEKALFRAAVLADGDRLGRRPHRQELGQVGKAAGRDVLELGGHRGTGLRHLVQRVLVIEGGHQMPVGNAAGGTLHVGIQHHQKNRQKRA